MIATTPRPWWERLLETLATGQPAVLVSIIRIQGSSPRETSATMLVDAISTADTLGGGELEYRAIHTARCLLAGEPVEPVARYVLGPDIGQCCGGVVWLLYETISADSYSHWQTLVANLYIGTPLLRQWRGDGSASHWQPLANTAPRQNRLTIEETWHGELVIGTTDFQLRLFGAGHVGRALANVLAMTDCHLQWIDARTGQLPASNTPRIQTRHCPQPVTAVHDAPPATWFIIMTHSHALDYELVEAILTRGDAAFCGLIGSATKSARFRRRLRAAGLSPDRIAELTCPIGITGIHDKHPQSIAIAIAAQLLQHRDTRRVDQSLPTACATSGEGR